MQVRVLLKARILVIHTSAWKDRHVERAGHVKFRSSDNLERPINEVWCNGSTIDFGSVSGGSSPSTLTNTAWCNKSEVRKCTIR